MTAKKPTKPMNKNPDIGENRNGILTYMNGELLLGDPLAADIKMNAISGKA